MNRVAVLDLPFHGTDRDFEALRGLPNVDLVKMPPSEFAQRGKGAKLIILPGSARTTSDLKYLRAEGGEELIRSHLAQGGFLFGICGGLQMMGEQLLDPLLTQGDETRVEGLSLIPFSVTTFGPTMLSSSTTASLTNAAGEIKGREHRSGQTTFGNEMQYSPLARIVSRVLENEIDVPEPATLPVADSNGNIVPRYWAPGTELMDGVVLDGMHIMASYIHLIFANPSFLSAVLPIVFP